MDRTAPAEVPEPHYIALYGGTGVGKSTFINDATGGASMQVGHDLRSCTQQVVASEPFKVDGQSVVLFDTPGFDDTTMSDADTLKRLAEFLESMYRRGLTLKGIVYLHRITDLRMMGASARTFRLLRSLCGAKNLANVTIVTNMWSDPPTEDEISREDQLKNEFFKAALESGAQMMRRECIGRQSAHAVLRAMLPRAPAILDIQRELVDRNVPLPQTDAGRLVEAELRFKLDKQEQELKDLRDEIKTALAESNQRAQRELEKYQERKERDMSLLRSQLASLSVEIEEGRRFWESQFEDMRARRLQVMRLAEEQEESLMDGYELGTPQRPILIALFGGTGVGKSSFANDASGGNMAVGRTLHSCTREVSRSPVFQIDGRTVALIDTPGFDDEEVSDVGTLKQIAAYLSSTYGEGQMLSGIIYLHRIVDNRMGGASARTFNLFRKMCGTQTLRNVVIATNMWSNPPKEQEERREQQLRTEFFKEALDGGARMVRRATTGPNSAHDIIRMLVEQVPLPTVLQSQIVDEGKRLADTDAGQEMEVQLLNRVNRQQREIDEARREIQDAVQRRDEESAAQLAQYEREKERDILELRRQIESLRRGMEDERRAFRDRLRREQQEFDDAAREEQRRRGFRHRVKNFFGMGPKQKAAANPA